ncbi:MAG: MerR family transcriptional regulator [Spirochaetes bacterium]|nr:MerR family transcriptional regulator [Spirochaetota bacterium]MBU1082228.1 MerR family transcriptional regulator [Spirochaetota bacterium]
MERLLGLGEHVLRYWERELPILSPSRSPFGRREWSASDISLLLRVRHLVKDRGLGLSATMDRLIAERSGSGADAAASLSEVRAALVSAYFESRAIADSLCHRIEPRRIAAHNAITKTEVPLAGSER